MTGIEQAIKAAGSQSALAQALGVSRNAVSLWKAQGWAPMPRARRIEALYGISRELIWKPAIREEVRG